MSSNSANDVTALRQHLFDTIEALKRTENPMPVDRARAISDVAKTIIDSARVENDAAKLHKRAAGSGFLPLKHEGSPASPPADGTPPVPPNGIKSITRHVLKDD